METAPVPSMDNHLRVPFWIVLAGVGAGAFWALAGVLVGARLRGRRHGRCRCDGHGHGHGRRGRPPG